MKSRYRSLYLKSDIFDGCSPVEASGDISNLAKRYAEDRFVIGPVADNQL